MKPSMSSSHGNSTQLQPSAGVYVAGSGVPAFGAPCAEGAVKVMRDKVGAGVKVSDGVRVSVGDGVSVNDGVHVNVSDGVKVWLGVWLGVGEGVLV
jgi:hypothetical protein